MQELNLKLTIDEANLILESLGQMPFQKVFALIGKLQEQAQQQLGDQPLPDEPGRGENPTPTIQE